jgi:hypothetical protein
MALIIATGILVAAFLDADQIWFRSQARGGLSRRQTRRASPPSLKPSRRSPRLQSRRGE